VFGNKTSHACSADRELRDSERCPGADRSSAPGDAASREPHARPVATKSRRRLRRRWLLSVLVLAALIAIVWARAYYLVSGLQRSGARQAGYIELHSISQPMQDATVAMEDGHFYRHRGFDWDAIRRAAEVDWDTFSIKQGGSTITQQLAKNLFLSTGRTFLRKIEEIPITCELERQLTKDQAASNCRADTNLTCAPIDRCARVRPSL
jgi:membrane peptidoglycan carboxypeptidase